MAACACSGSPIGLAVIGALPAVLIAGVVAAQPRRHRKRPARTVVTPRRRDGALPRSGWFRKQQPMPGADDMVDL